MWTRLPASLVLVRGAIVCCRVVVWTFGWKLVMRLLVPAFAVICVFGVSSLKRLEMILTSLVP